MSIQLRKELADIKEATNKLSSNFKQTLLPEKEKAIEMVKSQFGRYFKAQGFDVAPKGNDIKATYKGVNIILSSSAPHEQFLSGDATFTLTDTDKKRTYELLMSRGTHPSTSSFSEIPSNATEAEKLAYEIQREKHTFEELEKRVHEVRKGVNYKFVLLKEGSTELQYNRPGQPKKKESKKVFDSMEDFIKCIFG